MADQALPPVIPVFPLAGVIVMPGAELPFNIFEPRYLAMTRDALAGARLIGMVQPIERERPGQPPRLYSVGTVGRIQDWQNTDDGRILISLVGLRRFRTIEEMASATPYRQLRVDYGDFAQDDRIENCDGCAPLAADFKMTLGPYLQAAGIPADWRAIERANMGQLSSALAMICPFAPNEKQALLEARTAHDRCKIMIGLMKAATMGDKSSSLN